MREREKRDDILQLHFFSSFFFPFFFPPSLQEKKPSCNPLQSSSLVPPQELKTASSSSRPLLEIDEMPEGGGDKATNKADGNVADGVAGAAAAAPAAAVVAPAPAPALAPTRPAPSGRPPVAPAAAYAQARSAYENLWKQQSDTRSQAPASSAANAAGATTTTGTAAATPSNASAPSAGPLKLHAFQKLVGDDAFIPSSSLKIIKRIGAGSFATGERN